MATTIKNNINTKRTPNLPESEERQRALFAPFRERSVNAEHYDVKMKFWQDIIAEFCEHKGDATFTVREVQMAFVRGDRLPACLHDVVTHLLQTKRIRLRTEYEYDPENSWTGWAVNSFVRKPFSWGVTKIKTSVGWADEQTQSSLVPYVYLSVIETFCKWLQTKVLPPNQGKLLHYSVFKELCQETGVDLTDDCLQLALRALQRKFKIGLEFTLVEKERRIHLIKIPGQNQSSTIITDADRAVHNLQMTQANLLKQLQNIEEDIHLNENKVREYVKDNKRQLAKTYLRKKILLEKNHEKRSAALHNIEMLLSSVDEAQSNGDILDAYKIGSTALQNALESSGLKYDNVDEVIADVRESIDSHREVQDALSNASVSDTLNIYDYDELEREMQEIMGEAETPQPTGSRIPTTPVSPINNNNNSRNIKSNMVDDNGNAMNTKPIVTITDAELLALIDDLEVEDRSIRSFTQSEADNSNETVAH